LEFKPRADVDSRAINIATFADHVAKIDADAQCFAWMEVSPTCGGHQWIDD
jgi:hypothetical protein